MKNQTINNLTEEIKNHLKNAISNNTQHPLSIGQLMEKTGENHSKVSDILHKLVDEKIVEKWTTRIGMKNEFSYNWDNESKEEYKKAFGEYPVW